jgi:ATPase subunit of ABC transporter with duplicated ATPase domains
LTAAGHVPPHIRKDHSMGSISLRRVGVLTPRPLFENLSLVIGGADRVGLIAGNGGGKSTLLRCLAGLAEPTTGDIVCSRGLRVAFVEQDMPENLRTLPLAEAIRRALPPTERDANEWRVGVILDALGAPADLHSRSLGELSGGWQRLALIARAWVTEPDALLLDEPTNHLDLEKIQRLEAWIRDEAGPIPMVIASHDRSFLDACTTRTLFLRPGHCPSYAHPYSTARRLLADDDMAAERKLAKDSREAERLRRNAAELKNVGVNSGSDLLLRKAMQLNRRAETLEQTLRPGHTEHSGDIRLTNRGTHARVLLDIADLRIATPDGRALFRIEKLHVFQSDRIVLLGRNGVGKTLLMRRLRQAIASPDGVPGIRAAPSIVLGYVDQLMSQLPLDDTPYGCITAQFRLGNQRSTSLLAGAGFTVDMQRRQIRMLSPGQRARLGLLLLRLTEPNFYLLDEPTNHVDIAGQERLEAEILAHAPTCIAVSHDRSFVAAIATRFLLIEHGRVAEVDGPEQFYRSLAGSG